MNALAGGTYPVTVRPLTEVEDLDAILGGDEHVRGLEIAMDDALDVRGRETSCDRLGVLDGTPRPERSRRTGLPQRLALQELRDDERRTVVHADVEDRAD